MNKIKKIDVMPSGLVFLWEDESDTFVEFQKLRDLCPCAYYAGETMFLEMFILVMELKNQN